jgi:hypothetical protein
VTAVPDRIPSLEARMERMELRVRELVLLLRVLVVVACGNLLGHVFEQWIG